MLPINSILSKIFNQKCYTCLKPLLKNMNFCYAIIKGETLSKLAYGELGKRTSSDIDILIPRIHLKKIEEVLHQNGFINTQHSRKDQIIMLAGSHQISPWIKNLSPLGTMMIDLNFDIFWGEYDGKRINIEEFLYDTTEMDIYGVKVQTLPPVKAIIQLILHHYKDMNSIFLLATRNSIKYEMFKDVYYLLKNNLDTITLDKFYSLSESYKIIPYEYYMLYYTGQVFEDTVLNKYIDAFRTSKGEELLNYYGLCAKERKEWKFNFQTRLESDDLYQLIKNDLSEKDYEKIAINKRIF